MSGRLPIIAAVLAVVAAMSAVPALADAPAMPPPVDPAMTRTGTIGIESVGPRHERFAIASAAMRRVVTVDVLRGTGSGPRPLLYLLDGVDGEPTSGWLSKGGAAEFFADKPVDVVLTNGGTASMYSDWLRRDATLGVNRWETFLTTELPPIIESYLKTDGRRAIAGVSMGAQAAMMLAQRYPGRYRAAAGMSGCYSTADDLGRAVTTLTVASRGGNVENLWGPPDSPEWRAHDTLLGAATLRGTAIYLSAATGLPTDADLVAVSRSPSPVDALRTVGGGAALEAGARACTQRFADRLSELTIPATVDYAPAGMHTWPDFENQLPRAWRVLGPALGLPEPH